MKIHSNVFIISVMILALITSPISFSEFAFASQHEEYNESDESDLTGSVGVSDTIEIKVESTEDEDVEDTEEEEADATINEDTISNLGQEVSNFVKESRALFEQQKVEIKAVIQACRDSMRDALPSERQDVRKECKDNLKNIRDSYKDLRETYHDTFKQFRET